MMQVGQELRRRPDVTRAAQLDSFVAWLLGNGTQHDAGSSARTFRRTRAWCWNVDPVIPVTGEIYDDLTRITTREQAAAWEVRLHEWHQVDGDLINTKTYLRQAGARPSWARAKATWWWTHERLRKAYRLLERLTRQDMMFTYLREDLDGLGISSTTNWLDGGRNAGIKDLLRRHRSMTTDHQRRAVEWYCYLRSTKPAPPSSLIRPEHYKPTPTAAVITDHEPVPGGYGTTATGRRALGPQGLGRTLTLTTDTPEPSTRSGR